MAPSIAAAAGGRFREVQMDGRLRARARSLVQPNRLSDRLARATSINVDLAPGTQRKAGA